MSNEAQKEIERQIAKLRDDANALERDGGDPILVELKRDRAVGLEHTIVLTEMQTRAERDDKAKDWRSKFCSTLFWASWPVGLGFYLAWKFGVKLP